MAEEKKYRPDAEPLLPSVKIFAETAGLMESTSTATARVSI